MDIEGIPEEKTHASTLIKVYGEFWNPDLVKWETPKELLGRETENVGSRDVNVFEERGVYVLYNNFVPVYVGKAFRQSIGKRLQLHRASRKKGPRWDSFSWFGLQALKADGNPRVLKQIGSFSIPALIETLEALLIVVIDPRLNSRQEKLRGARYIHQSVKNKLPDTNDRLQAIEESVKLILSKQTNQKR